MRMQGRVIVVFLGLVILLLGLIRPAFLAGAMGIPPIGWILMWIALVPVVVLALLRCPNCRRVALFKPGGGSSPAVGDHCRFCGVTY